jgi:hypothetical protein
MTVKIQQTGKPETLISLNCYDAQDNGHGSELLFSHDENALNCVVDLESYPPQYKGSEEQPDIEQIVKLLDEWIFNKTICDLFDSDNNLLGTYGLIDGRTRTAGYYLYFSK